VRQRAFTLIEMLTTVAVLIIVLGLMVSLARNVRDRSAHQLTHDLLRQLTQLIDEYREDYGRQLPPVASIIPARMQIRPDETQLADLAKINNEQMVKALRPGLARLDRSSDAGPGSLLGQLPLAVYDGLTLRDAWGSPIVFMPEQHHLIGMAPKGEQGGTHFFFSAGPDRQYLTRDDNLYSYETAGQSEQSP
jgi:type II secretory pathway pseudopilin PulG